MATGDYITSTVYSYLVSLTLTVNVISETCEALRTVLVETVMPGKLRNEDWLNISSCFENKWDFSYCIRAIDGKYVAIEVH